jgi:hypothetical protein
MGLAKAKGGVALHLRDPANSLQRVPENVSYPLQGAEEIAQHGKGAPPYPGEKQSRSAGPVDAPLDSSYLQIAVQFSIDANYLAVILKIPNAFSKIAITHGRHPSFA